MYEYFINLDFMWPSPAVSLPNCQHAILCKQLGKVLKFPTAAIDCRRTKVATKLFWFRAKTVGSQMTLYKLCAEKLSRNLKGVMGTGALGHRDTAGAWMLISGKVQYFRI